MSGINRLLSRRDKRENGHNSKAAPVPTAANLYGLFSVDDKKKVVKDEDKKVKSIKDRLDRHRIWNLDEKNIRFALRTKYAGGDTAKAFEFLELFEDAMEGIVKEYDPNVKLLGAENREGVTCWLDSLLFAMFSRLGSFESMLYESFDDDPRRNLAALLRFWVNLLRTGKLITEDITKHLQEAIAACGWRDSAQLVQQDVSEAFTFLTGTLKLPLLTLKMDIFHTGKEDEKDDHKLINERLLEVAIPPDPGHGRTINLEDCLESYFNNRIEVKRHLERRSTMTSVRSMDSSKGQAVHVETVEVDSAPSTPTSQMAPSTSLPSRPLATRHRAASIFTEREVIKEDKEHTLNGDDRIEGPGRRKGSIRKEVMMPAWQFFSLIPWYTNNAPTTDAQVSDHFHTRRPVLGLCLKRYALQAHGEAERLGTYIDIPLEIGLPHFIQDDRMDEEDAPLFGNFKLSLQSVVCHRGSSIHAGHYIALVRGRSPNARRKGQSTPDRSRSSVDEEPEDDAWMLFDDSGEERVTYIDIVKTLKEESPYLLFYQVQPIDDSYSISPSTASHDHALSDSITADSNLALAPSSPGASRNSFEANNLSLPSLESPRGRRSLEVPGGRTSTSSDRPSSITFADDSGSRLATAPVTPAEEISDDTLIMSRPVSKAGKESRSRAHSPVREARLSATFSRLAHRMSREKPAEQITLDLPSGDGPAHETTTTDKSKLKRGFSRSRSRRPHGENTRHKKNKVEPPERQCVLM